jgi:predicted nucleic acid-binding protein
MQPSARLSERMLKKIADAGLLIAALDARDQNHGWARQVLERESPPWLVCEPVLAEVSASIGTPLPVLEMLHRGDLEIAFELSDNATEALALARKYRDQGMDLADACVVRMSELLENSVVYTVDRKDFSCYRRRGRHAIRCEFPPTE